MRKLFVATCLAALLPWPAAAASITVDVFANANSSSGGTGLLVGSVTAGELLTISVNSDDLWSAGALPRWSTANGLTGPDLLATGTDESGALAGTIIGSSIFGLHSQGGLTAPFGSLVGQIGSTSFLVGTFFNGTAPATGDLRLFYWDSNNGDNSDSVRATIRTSPEPGLLGLLGLAALAGVRSLRKRN